MCCGGGYLEFVVHVVEPGDFAFCQLIVIIIKTIYIAPKNRMYYRRMIHSDSGITFVVIVLRGFRMISYPFLFSFFFWSFSFHLLFPTSIC